MTTAVTEIPTASPTDAEAHFAAEFTFETDCWDVHDALSTGSPPTAADQLAANLAATI